MFRVRTSAGPLGSGRTGQTSLSYEKKVRPLLLNPCFATSNGGPSQVAAGENPPGADELGSVQVTDELESTRSRINEGVGLKNEATERAYPTGCCFVFGGQGSTPQFRLGLQVVRVHPSMFYRLRMSTVTGRMVPTSRRRMDAWILVVGPRVRTDAASIDSKAGSNSVRACSELRTSCGLVSA